MKDAQDVMAITWNIDEARATIRAQMAEVNRLDEVIDDLSAETSAALARAEAAEAEAAECRAERARYGDIMTSKLASAEARIVELEANVELLRAALADARSELANLDDNLRLSRDTWTEWHSDVARQRISFVLPDDTSDHDAS